jgi:hypothetical protein
VLDASCCICRTDAACWICVCLWELWELLLLLLARVLRDPSLSSTSASLSRVLDFTPFDQVVDIVVEIRVSLSVVATVAVLLIEILVCTESRCRECVQKNGLQFAIGWTMVERWTSVWKLCVSEIVRCLTGFDVCLELYGWRCRCWPYRIFCCWCRSVDDCVVGVALHGLLQRSDEVLEVL